MGHQKNTKAPQIMYGHAGVKVEVHRRRRQGQVDRPEEGRVAVAMLMELF